MLHRLYEKKGLVLLEFDPEKHEYFIGDKKIDNMTGIVKILSNTPAMINWATKTCTDTFKSIIKAGKSYDELEIENMALQIKQSVIKKRDDAGVVGTKIHDYIEQYLYNKVEPEIFNLEMKNSFSLFKDWLDKQKNFKIIFTERKVYSKQYNYTGTTDFLFQRDDEYFILDWKTSSGIYPNFYLQLTGYAMALEEELDIKISKGIIANFPKKNKSKIVEFDIDSSIRQNFLSCLNLYQFINKKEK